jgi:TP901 family phage tail tape measure protein
MASLYELFVKLSADVSGFKGPLKDAKKDMGDFGAAGEALGEKLGALATKWASGMGLAALGAFAFHAAQKIEEANFIIQRSTGATGEKLEGLEKSFKAVYAGTSASSEEVAKALSMISIRSGLAGTALEATTSKMLKLAKVTNSDIVAIAPTVTRVFADWGVAAERQGYAMDVLAQVTQKTGVTLSNLAERMTFFGAPLRQVGFQFEQAAVLIGRFEAEGVNSETVLTSLRLALGKLLQSGKYDTASAFGELIRQMKDAKTEAEGLELSFKAFGRRAAVDLYRSIIENRWDEFISGQAFKVRQSLDETANETKTFGSRWKAMMHEVELASAPLGAIALGPLTQLAKAFNDASKERRDFFSGKESDSYKRMALNLEIEGPLTVPKATPPGVPAKWRPTGASSAAAELSAAFAGLGLRSQSELKEMAAAAQTNYDIVVAASKRGQAATEDVIRAQTLLQAAVKALAIEYEKSDRTATAKDFFDPEIKFEIDAIIQRHKDLKKEIPITRQAWADWSAVMIEGKAPLNDTQRLLVAMTAAIDPTSENMMRLANEHRKLKELQAPVNYGLIEAADHVRELDAALQRAGASKFNESIKQAEEDLRIVGDALEAGEAEVMAYLKTWLKLVETMRSAGVDISPAILKEAEAVKQGLEGISAGTHKVLTIRQQAEKDVEQATRRTFDSMAQGMAKSLIEWKGWGAALKNVAKDFAEGMLTAVIKGFLTPLEDAVARVVKSITGKLMDALGIGGKATGGAASGAGSAGSAAGGIGGAVGGGITGIVGAVGSVVSAVSGVIGNFQMYGMNKSLDLIEHETRYAQIHLLNILEKMNAFLPKLADIWSYGWDAQYPLLLKMTSALEAGQSGGTTININGAGDPRAVAQEVARALRLQVPAAAFA